MPVALVADPLPPRDLLPPPPVPSPTPPLGPTAPAPREKSVDDLLAELEDLQAQKARLEKQEAELKATIRKRLDAQTERLKKLGVTQEAKGPDRVGRIIIEGNTKTPDKKILALLELQPGQILTYLGLEEARARFKKGKFSATVEVIPNELDSTFKDIRVKVVEPDAR
ncbi:MAG: hypothetical protein J0I06_07160 [Planctomycetes bacterium]|nr:hypothetical protein [Planctomycetota bacterium]